MRPIIAVLLLLCACAPPDAAPPAVPVEAPPALLAAHAAYRDGDVTRVAARLRETLDSPEVSGWVHDNALALLEAAYAVGRGTIGAEWELPPGVDTLRVMHLRKEEPTSVVFQIALRGIASRAGAVRQLRLSRGEAVVLDRAAGVGVWSETPEPDGGHFFELEGPEVPEPLDEGLYRLEIELADGGVTRGWFILGGLTSTRAPRVDAPLPGAITGPTPRLRFEDFRSPAHQPWEGRALGAWVVSAPPRAPWRPAWSVWRDRPAQTALEVADPLAPGDYWFGLNFAESRRFGPLTLVRASRVAVPFSVRP